MKSQPHITRASYDLDLDAMLARIVRVMHELTTSLTSLPYNLATPNIGQARSILEL